VTEGQSVAEDRHVRTVRRWVVIVIGFGIAVALFGLVVLLWVKWHAATEFPAPSPDERQIIEDIGKSQPPTEPKKRAPQGRQ
jgi:hypothetical protein